MTGIADRCARAASGHVATTLPKKKQMNSRRLMTASGAQRTGIQTIALRKGLAKSALGQKRNMCSAQRHVRFTPNSDSESGLPQTVMFAKGQKRTFTRSIDHLVSIRKEGWWYVETKRFGGGQVDDQIKFGRLLDRKIARLRATKNLVDIVGGAPKHVRVVWSVGYKTSGLDKITDIKDCR